MADLLNEVERLRKDRESVAHREIELPMQLSEARAKSEQLRTLARTMGPADASSALLPSVQAWTAHERRNYSLQRLIMSLAKDPMGKDGCPEREMSHAIAEDLHLAPAHSGVYVPTSIRMESGQDSRTGAAGGFTIARRVEDIVTYLRAKSVVLRMGGTLLSGLNSQVGIPLQTSGTTATWSSENPGSDIAQTDSVFGNITPTPRTLTASTAYSRGLLTQSSADVEAFLRSDLAASHAAALDSAAFIGKGTSGEPIGLQHLASVPVVAIGADGGAPTGAILADLERTVADYSADLGMLGWATSPTMRMKLRQVPLFTNSSIPCWTGDEGADQCLGSPAVVSKSLPQTLTKGNNSDCHMIVCGYFPALAFASWGVLEITVDPFTLKKRGMIEITSHQLCDVIIQRPTAFALCVDARNV